MAPGRLLVWSDRRNDRSKVRCLRVANELRRYALEIVRKVLCFSQCRLGRHKTSSNTCAIQTVTPLHHIVPHPVTQRVFRVVATMG